MHTTPRFVISLDFELYWGMTDKVSLEEYGENIRGVHEAILEILNIFRTYELHATWATVGMLMYADSSSLDRALPKKDLRPQYLDPALSNYEYVAASTLREHALESKFHFGPHLVRDILDTSHQEIGSHTFSHYYILEKQSGENSKAVFTADCTAMQRAADQFGITLTSIVFPRNQVSEEALSICRECGFRAYRGTEDHVLYRSRPDGEQSLFIRGLRLLDHYINISGHHTIAINRDSDEHLVNVPSSRFLRPYSPAFWFLEPLRMRRIKNAMTHAAKRGEVFHLWWHPHNFGTNLEENMKNLRNIAEHFKVLQEKYGMESAAMHEVLK